MKNPIDFDALDNLRSHKEAWMSLIGDAKRHREALDAAGEWDDNDHDDLGGTLNYIDHELRTFAACPRTGFSTG